MVLAGSAYVVIGVVFAALDDSPDPGRVRLWRLAAWVASGIVGVAHIAYEHYRRGSAPGTTARHAAGAVGLGAFGLGVAANVHGLFTDAHGQRALLLALPIWPLVTALPVFLLTLAVTTILARFSRRA